MKLLEPLEPRRLLTSPPASIGPSAREQYMLELINRARLAPATELQLLLASPDPGVQGGISFFRVNKDALRAQWASLQPVPPLAWNDDLARAADAHSLQMLAFDEQSHQLPGEKSLGDRALAAGYDYSFVGENVYASAESILQSHAAFLIDWGNTPTGIQTPAGHRENLFAPQPGTQGAGAAVYTEIGLSVIDGVPVQKNTGPLLVTQDLGSRQNAGDPFLLGVAYADNVKQDNFYTEDEGLAGLTVTATRVDNPGSITTTTTFAAGGYQMALAPGTYTVTLAGPGLQTPVTRTVTLAGNNVKQDFSVTTVDQDPGPDDTSPLTGAFVGRIPPALKPGQKASARLRITNPNPAAFAGTLNTTFYFSADPVLDASDYALKTITSAVSIAPARFRDVPLRFNSPLDLPDGSYYLIAADASDPASPVQIAASATATHVVAPTTNLKPFLTGRLRLTRAGALPVTLRIRNTGTSAATGTMTVTLAARPANGGPDILLQSFGPGDVTVRPRGTTLLRTLLTPALPPGTYRLVANVSSILSTPDATPADNAAVSAGTFSIA